MRIDLSAKVRTRDGEYVGKIRYAIFDPGSRDVTQFVVGTRGLLGRDIVVPSDTVVPPEIAEDTSFKEPVVDLTLSKAELKQMPDFDRSRYAVPPSGWASPPAYGYPTGNVLWSDVPAVEPPLSALDPEAMEMEKQREVTVGKGSTVFDRAGGEIGVVEDLRFDTLANDLNAVVVRLGGTLQTLFGGGETLEVPTEMIENVTPAGVHLRASEEDLRQMARSRSRY